MLSNLASTPHSLWSNLPSILYDEAPNIPPLPVELIMQIIEHAHKDRDVLRACSLVSRTWHPTAHSLLYGRPTVMLFDTPEIDLLSILQRLTRITRDLNYVRALTIKHRISARHSDLPPTVLTFRTLIMLTALLPNLKGLEMVNLQLRHEALPPSGLVEESNKYSPRDWVKTMVLHSVTYEPPSWEPRSHMFDYLFTIFPGIQHLFCHGDTERQHIPPASVETNAVVLQRAAYPPLKTLSLNSLRSKKHPAGFVQGIRPFLQSLETLDYTDHGVPDFVSVCKEWKGCLGPSLKTLRFAQDERIVTMTCLGCKHS